jgi:hypothetical protein
MVPAHVSRLEQAKQSGVQTQDASSLAVNWTYQAQQHQLSGPERQAKEANGEHHTAYEEIFNEGLK